MLTLISESNSRSFQFPKPKAGPAETGPAKPSDPLTYLPPKRGEHGGISGGTKRGTQIMASKTYQWNRFTIDCSLLCSEVKSESNL